MRKLNVIEGSKYGIYLPFVVHKISVHYEIKLDKGTWSMVGVAEKGEEHDKLTRNILQRMR